MGYENSARLPGKVLESWCLVALLEMPRKGKRNSKRQLEECLKKGRDVRKKREGASNRVQGMSEEGVLIVM